MNHDIAAEIRAAFRLGLSAVESVRITDAQRQMVEAVGIQPFDRVDSFGHLQVALAKFWPRHSAGCENGIRTNEPLRTLSAGGVELQLMLCLQADQNHSTRWIADFGLSKVPLHSP